MSASELRELLALNVESAADWRLEKAAQFPHDQRNQDAAERLRRIAADLNAMPDDHPALRRLWWEYYRPHAGAAKERDDKFLSYAEAESSFIKAIGFHCFPGGGAEFLEELGAELPSGGDE